MVNKMQELLNKVTQSDMNDINLYETNILSIIIMIISLKEENFIKITKG